jgi:hypothetical protein
MALDDAEVRVRSIPAAGHLLASGFQPTRIISDPSGSKTVCFSPDDRQALNSYYAAKSKIYALLGESR